MADFRDVMRRQIVKSLEPAPDPAAVFLAELRSTMIDSVTHVEATRSGPEPLTIQAQSFDSAAPGGYDAPQPVSLF